MPSIDRADPVADDRPDAYAARLEADLAGMRRLYELQARLAVETELKPALGEIVAAAAEFTGTDRGCVQLLSADGERLEMFVHRGYEPGSGFIRQFLTEGSKPACDAARDGRQRIIIDDVATCPALLDTEDRRIALAEDIRATQSTPMVSRRGELVGVLSTQFRQPHRPSDHELKLIDMLAWTAADFVDRHLTEAALRTANEARYRRMLDIETVPIVFFDLVGGISDANDAFLDMIGYSRAELQAGQVRYEALTPPDWAWRDQQTLAELQATGQSKPFEKEYFRRDGSRIWIYCAGKMLDERTAVEFIIDLTERKRAEARLRESESRLQALVHELQHRTRNLMGVVRSTASKLLNSSVNLEDFAERFESRIDALARVQGLLSRLEEHDRVSFDVLLRSELEAMGASDNAVSLEGPAGVRLRSSTVQMLAMALHELATNALKYGALGQPDARLVIRWRLEPADEAGQPWLQVEWRETGVSMPGLKPATLRRGQGRELIERALPYQLRARTSFELGADGVRCTMALPVSLAKEGPDG